MLLLYISVHWSISARCSVHLLHRKRKCSTVSLASPQSHWSDGAALIRNRYAFNLAIPVLNWARTEASFPTHWSYSCRVCLPGSAVSTLLESFPTFSGNLLVVLLLGVVTLSVVDRTLGTGVCGSLACRVASLAFSLAWAQSSSFSPNGSHTTVILSHFTLSFAMDL